MKKFRIFRFTPAKTYIPNTLAYFLLDFSQCPDINKLAVCIFLTIIRLNFICSYMISSHFIFLHKWYYYSKIVVNKTCHSATEEKKSQFEKTCSLSAGTNLFEVVQFSQFQQCLNISGGFSFSFFLLC